MKLPVFLLALYLLADFVPSESKVYFVTPSPDVPCRDKFEDNDPCLTLSQYASKPSSYFNKTSFFFIEPGDHYLTKVFSLRNMETVNIIVIDRDNTKVTCKKSANFQFHKISGRIAIQGLHMFNCGGNTISSVNTVLWGFSTFQGQDDNGTALEFRDTKKAQIYTSQFVANTGKKIPWPGLQEAIAGGAILANNTNLDISDCVFRDNNANVGGAIYAINGSLETHNTTFIDNQVNRMENGSISGCMGGAIYVRQPSSDFATEVSITTSSFIGNSAIETRWCKGGGLYILSVSKVTITLSEFTDNSAKMEGGGAVIVAGESKISFSNFSYNRVVETTYNGHGGGLYYGSPKTDSMSNLTIDSCNFSHNRVTGKGGGYGSFSDYDYKFTIINSTFHNNTAEDSGGAIFTYRTRASVNITETTFTENSATRVGVALFLGGEVNLTNTTFVGNIGRDPRTTTMIEMVDRIYSGVLRSTGFLKIQGNTVSSVIAITKGSAIISGHTLISGNTGPVSIASGNISFDGITEFVNNTFVPSPENEIGVAAAVTCTGGKVSFQGNTSFLYNSGMYGGPIIATQSVISISGDIIIASSEAMLYDTTLMEEFRAFLDSKETMKEDKKEEEWKFDTSDSK